MESGKFRGRDVVGWGQELEEITAVDIRAGQVVVKD